MTALPRVAHHTRERVSREFDDFGPEACVAAITADLKNENPELLDMAWKWARDVGPPEKMMLGFCMFYRLLVVESRDSSRLLIDGGAAELSGLPRVTAETRDRIVHEIDEHGVEAFTRSSLDTLERSNPELLLMAHAFASRYPEYLRIMQGFGLLYAALSAQAQSDDAYIH